MVNEIYCVYDEKYVDMNKCDDCDRLYECDNMWCDNHQCKDICEYKKNNECKGMI